MYVSIGYRAGQRPREVHTLSANASIPSNADSLAYPILAFSDMLVHGSVFMLLLLFVQDVIMLGGY